MASQVTEGIVTIAWAPCPPERMPALRYGINMLFDWLESLPDAPAEQEPLAKHAKNSKDAKITILSNNKNSQPWESIKGTQTTQPWESIKGTQTTQPWESIQGTQSTLGG